MKELGKTPGTDRFVAARDSAGLWRVKDTLRGTTTTPSKDRDKTERAAARKSAVIREMEATR